MALSKKILSRILCLLAYTIFGFSFLFSKMALNRVSPLTLVSVRFLMAFLLLNGILLLGKETLHLKGKPVWKLLLLGTVQPVIYFLAESYGISMTSASYAGVMLGMLPVVGLLCGVLFLKEKVTRKGILCVLLSVLGVVLTTIGGPVKFSFLGTLLLFTAVFSAAFFGVLSKNTAEVFTAFERTYVMFLLGSVVFTLLALLEGKGDLSLFTRALTDGKVLVSVLYLAGLSSVAAFLFLNKALEHISVGEETIYSNFCTVVSIPAGILILHDSFSVYQLLGILIILVSVFLISMEKNGHTVEH
ncbi:MAG: DMT family transporter [Spirochaetales bacterium]|nr:DMT family transporter [Candidatus Physcosoma equi]